MFSCDFCNREFKSKAGLLNHTRACQLNPDVIKGLYKSHCKYCNKECKSDNSLHDHERFCKLNHNRQLTAYEKYGPIPGFNNKGHKAWNKGLTKETDERLAKSGETLSNNLMSGKAKKSFEGKHHSEETRKKLREAAIKQGLGGTTHKKLYNYQGTDIYFDSSYELSLASDLDRNNIRWERCKRLVWHDLENNTHHYTPDFYLPDYDVYLDPKNDYLIEKDTSKINQVMAENGVRVLILDKYHLTWDSIKTLL